VANEIAAHFQFRPDWRRCEKVRGSVQSYYAQIRSLLRKRPELRPCLKRCKHCRIFFFTHPRNVGRDDLRCGFGCRQAHRRQRDTRRCTAYYLDNPAKKRHQNRKRYLRSAQTCRDSAAEPQSAPPVSILAHIRMVLSLIERRRVELYEIVGRLAKKGRQPRMARRRPGAYGRRRIEGRGS
jgi:hypothetical protein